MSGITGGTFSAAAGLTINSSDGTITPSASIGGTYTVTYTVAPFGGCAVFTTTSSVSITSMPTAAISYTGSPFCKSVTTGQLVTTTGTGAYTGGAYSAPSGLSINSTTGAITPNASTAGTYTVSYTTSPAGGCGGVTTTASVTITDIPAAIISYRVSHFVLHSMQPRLVYPEQEFTQMVVTALLPAYLLTRFQVLLIHQQAFREHTLLPIPFLIRVAVLQFRLQHL